MARSRAVAACLVLWISVLRTAGAATLTDCKPDVSAGRAVVSRDCRWTQQQIGNLQNLLIQGEADAGMFPKLAISPARTKPGLSPSGYSLTIKRLVISSTLTPASGAIKLLPLGLVSEAPRNLTLMDVRFIISQQEFDDYLKLLSKQLRSNSTDVGTGPSMLTDGTSFLNIPYWSDNTTQVFSLTLVAGPCHSDSTGSSLGSDVLQQSPARPGCNIRTVDNTTLVPTLVRDAAVSTSQPLLVRLTTNVTLGPGLLRPISIRRPVLLLGMASALTSVDLGMVVNQLNVTPPYGKIYWQSLVLENLAPGDTTSSMMASPFSTTVTSNVWAMYCNRSNPCLNLSNVTLVVPSQEELNYQVFMYTMYNSPAPALRELTEFYRTDLDTKVIQFLSGPGNDTLTMIRLKNSGWNMWYTVSTLRSFVAPRRALPRQAFSMQKYRAGALVQAVQDCSGFVSALSSRSSSTRMRVWTLISNVSIADNGQMACAWPDGNITYPMQLLGQVVHTHGPFPHLHGPMERGSTTEAIVLSAADGNNSSAVDPYSAYEAVRSAGLTSPPLSELYAVSFGYLPSLFQLPVDAQDKYLQIQNVTLLQLPQMARNRGLAGRRLMQQQQQRGAGASPIGIWTIMLWGFRRTMLGVPVTVQDSQLLLPQPEWEVLADQARQASSFALQLQGQSGGLTFTGVSMLDNKTLHVGAFQGPGIAGSNLWLLPDPHAANMPGYEWPAGLLGSSDASSGGSGHTPIALRAGIGVAVAVLGILAVGLLACVVRKRQRHTGHLAAKGCVGGGAGPVVLGPVAAGYPGPTCHKQLVVLVDEAGDAHADVVEVRDTAGQAHKVVGQLQPSTAAAVEPSRRNSADRSHSKSSKRSSSSEACADLPTTGPGSDGEGTQEAGSTVGTGSARSVEQTIAHGLERWNAAVSLTTLQMMQRRHQTNNSLYTHLPSSVSSGSKAAATGATQQEQLLQQQQQQLPAPPSAAGASGDSDQGLQLFGLLGTGSFGSVYLGTWRGKRVAVKVMHLNANALLAAEGLPGLGPEQQQQQLQRQKQQNSPPHMAIMEAVVSSTMCHPNVVQVYTYMLSPLVVRPVVEPGQPTAAPPTGQEQQQQQPDGAASEHHGGGVFGYQLRIVMEWCSQGTLREALDKRRLPRLPGTGFTHPSVVYSLSHDIAAATLHLHSEGIVHGDLKAGNVLLTANLTPGSSGCAGDQCADVDMWLEAGSQPLSAKVADFGMAMPLGPQDTHATMLARGTPTHMSPELFIAGHVSKASDVYAYGILLYEIITGSRAYAGVPIPLLPHEVAMQRLRPQWPKKASLAPNCQRLRELAEACWTHKAQDRPTFEQILRTLEGGCYTPQEQQQQQPELDPALQAASPGQQQQQQVQQRAAGDGAPAAAVGLACPVERKPSKDPMSWSEVSYGRSQHNGAWA